MEEVHKAMESERNDGDEGFVEDYIDHDHHDEERVELSHPDNLSTSSQDDEEEVTHVVHCSVQTNHSPFFGPMTLSQGLSSLNHHVLEGFPPCTGRVV